MSPCVAGFDLRVPVRSAIAFHSGDWPVSSLRAVCEDLWSELHNVRSHALTLPCDARITPELPLPLASSRRSEVVTEPRLDLPVPMARHFLAQRTSLRAASARALASAAAGRVRDKSLRVKIPVVYDGSDSFTDIGCRSRAAVEASSRLEMIPSMSVF